MNVTRRTVSPEIHNSLVCSCKVIACSFQSNPFGHGIGRDVRVLTFRRESDREDGKDNSRKINQLRVALHG